MISVIVPVYNVEKYLEKCIKSIAGQTYSNLEILLIDDGSTDNSGALCDEYAKNDSRIRVIHKENGGLSDARNTGIVHSTGDYLVFVDSDDYVHSEFIEKLYNAMKKSDSDMSICNFSRVFDHDKINDNEVCVDEVITSRQAIQKLFEKGSVYFIVAWNKLYKRKLFENVKFPVGRINEDEFVAHRLLGQCKKIACIQDSFYYYLQRSGSIMGNLKKSNFDYCLNRADFMLDRMHYLKSLQMDYYAAKAYLETIYMYLAVFEKENSKNKNESVFKRKKMLKKEIRKNIGISNCLGFKQKVKIFMIFISPKVYNICRHIRSVH